MKAVVMAGGEGSRLRPITVNRPKPLVPICNQPIMEHIVTLLKRHGITEVVSTLYYLGDEIQAYFGDGSDHGISMTYSVEDTPLGTAGSVKKAERLLSDGTFVIVSGDALTDCDLTKAIEFHKRKKSMATLILYRVPNPLDFGVVITGDDGRILRFLEKPSWSEVFSDTVNTGMYILEPEVFDLMEVGGNYDWSKDIFPRILAEGKPLYGYVMDEYWCDVGSLTQYREAQEDMLSGKVNLPVAGAEFQPGVWVDVNTVIEEGAVIAAPVCIGRGCKIKAGATLGPYTTIGDNSLVMENATAERSVVWDGAYIGLNAGIHSATLGSRVTVKRDAVVREDAVVADRCLLDVGSLVRPRVKLWPDKIIERGATVTMSLVWGNKWRGQLFRELGVAGLSNIEITPDFATRLGSAFGSCLPPRSKVVTARDSTRSSRMVKRAIIASLLSVGCDVLDLRSSAPLPITRHFIKASGAAGAINVRKLPGNSRVTLVEMLNASGAYISKNLERKVETTFFREDYHRADPDDLGVIEFASRAIEEYRADFFRHLGGAKAGKTMRIVCDFGFSALASIFPSMLSELGVESLSLNAYNDAKRSPRTPAEIDLHLDNLKSIVGKLGYDIGVLFTEEGERMTAVDDQGNLVQGNALLAVVATLIAQTHPGARIAMSVAAPSSLERRLVEQGAHVVRTKADTRSLLDAGVAEGATFAGDDRGGFLFPELHPGFDGMFGFCKLIAMLQQTGLTLSGLLEALPKFFTASETLHCPWEAKGGVMRVLAEESAGGRVELLDGIKVYGESGWVLVLPDSVDPVFHVVAESEDAEGARDLVAKTVARIRAIQATAAAVS